MTLQLKGKTALITGASRGIGAATAIKLAELGADIVLNYRSKAARALDVVEKLQALGVKVLPVQADITDEAETAALFATVDRLDLLILNASGGMEKDRPEDYAMLLNRDAQIRLTQSAAPLMPPGSRIVFITSHWAHFYGSKPVMPDYEAVAKSKHAVGKLAACPPWTISPPLSSMPPSMKRCPPATPFSSGLRIIEAALEEPYPQT